MQVLGGMWKREKAKMAADLTQMKHCVILPPAQSDLLRLPARRAIRAARVLLPAGAHVPALRKGWTGTRYVISGDDDTE